MYLATPMVAVVVNWNLPDETRTCLESLRAADGNVPAISLVDNGSTDDSVAIFQQCYPEVDLITLPENRGYAAANNIGIKHALDKGAEWVLLVNNDVILAHDAPSGLIQGVTRGGYDIVMPRIDVLGTETLWHVGAVRRRWNPLPRPLTVEDIADGAPKDVDYAVGCVLLIHRRVFERIGLLDEQYFVYYEDLDFCTRAAKAGFRIGSVPSARAWHHVSASSRNDTPRRAYLITRQRTLWCRSQGVGFAAGVWWLAHIHGLWRGLLGGLLRRDHRLIRAIISGLSDGIRHRSVPEETIPRISSTS